MQSLINRILKVICATLVLWSSAVPLWATPQADTMVVTAHHEPTLADRQATVSRWKTQLDEISGRLDSVKSSLYWQRATSDPTETRSLLAFFQQTKGEIVQEEHSIRAARLIWAASEVEWEGDSPLDLESTMSDSLRTLSVLLVDTLSKLENSFARLRAEVDYQEQNTLRQWEELNAEGADSAVQHFMPDPSRIMKSIRTNMGRDGYAVAIDYPVWSNRIFLILCSLLYFYFMYRLGRRTENEEDLRLHQNEPLWIPLLKALIFFLVLLPLASFVVPVLVLEISYFLIFIALFIILYPELSAFKTRVLIWILVYYTVLIIANLVQSELWWSRIFSILINLGGVLLVWSMGRRTDVDNPVGFVPKYARWAIMIGHLLSVSFNLAGYIYPARMLSIAAGIGLLQALSLRSFRDMILHDLENQYQRANQEGVFKRFNLQRMLKSADRVIRLCCGILIALVLLNTLQLTREVREWLERILFREHHIGDISYDYASLLVAAAVIWTANWLQKNLNSLIEKPRSNELEKRRMTLFPLVRLLIIVVAFLLAINILGLGLDRLTVIVGALSVGVGLGLQHIINNFVSGIILVFEKPFKAGDYVELADKKGQVIQIGLRSSVLMTDDGARVIIPNSDFIAGRLVNWTFTESDIRVNMQLTVQTNGQDISEIKERVRTKLARFDEVDPSIPIKVYTKEISADHYTLSIQVGIEHVRLIERFRSQFLEELKKELNGIGVTVSSA